MSAIELEDFLAKNPEMKRRFDFHDKLGKQNHRGMVLLIHAELEQALENILAAYLTPGKWTEGLFKSGSPPLGTFAAKVNLARALDLITTTEWQDLHLMRKIRNEFAHNPDASFSDQKLQTFAGQISTRSGEPEEIEVRCMEMITDMEEAAEEARKRLEEEKMGAAWQRRACVPRLMAEVKAADAISRGTPATPGH